MKEKERQQLEKLAALLEIEKQEDFEQYRKLVQSLPLAQRREEGYSWHPLNIVKEGYTMGERAFVIVERTNHLEQAHKFRSGKTVSLFTQQADTYKPEKVGVINFVENNRMKIVLNSKDLPDWLHNGDIGVDIQFDDRTYLEMEKALQQVMAAKGNRLAELRRILMGFQEAAFQPVTSTLSLPSLNSSQFQAVQQIQAARDVAIVHGPPGTGKTTTVVQAVKVLCQTENTVLVTAPSNTAVDLLTVRMAEEGLNVVRIGNISRVDEGIIQHTLEYQASKHPEMKMIKKVRLEAAETRRKVRRLRGKGKRRDWNLFRQLKTEARELSGWARRLEEQLVDQILDAAQVITCTLVSSTQKVLGKRKFRTLVIDEAAQALEPATWIPILRASKVVLTGDPFQLPPTVKSQQAKQEGFNVTLLEKCIEFVPKVSLLDTQYRMNEVIMNFSNQMFYHNVLKAADSVRHHRLEIADNEPMIFIDTAGCGFDEQVNEELKSRFNPDEFQILCEHLYQLIAAHQEKEVDLPAIAIISPYREQVVYMKQMVKEDSQLSEIPLVINTIDGFQGQEKEVVYISLVRSNEKAEIGFLKDYRRMNVAMTRAKKQLIVVGDSATIGADKFYGDFLEYVEIEGSYRSAWTYMQ